LAEGGTRTKGVEEGTHADRVERGKNTEEGRPQQPRPRRRRGVAKRPRQHQVESREGDGIGAATRTTTTAETPGGGCVHGGCPRTKRGRSKHDHGGDVVLAEAEGTDTGAEEGLRRRAPRKAGTAPAGPVGATRTITMEVSRGHHREAGGHRGGPQGRGHCRPQRPWTGTRPAALSGRVGAGKPGKTLTRPVSGRAGEQRDAVAPVINTSRPTERGRPRKLSAGSTARIVVGIEGNTNEIGTARCSAARNGSGQWNLDVPPLLNDTVRRSSHSALWRSAGDPIWPFAGQPRLAGVVPVIRPIEGKNVNHHPRGVATTPIGLVTVCPLEAPLGKPVRPH